MIIVLCILLIMLIVPPAVYLFMILRKSGEPEKVTHPPSKEITTLSVILPCYNEASNIGRKINEIIRECEYLENYEIIIIDDGSGDETREKIGNLADKKNIRTCYLNERRGKAAALNLGVSKTKFEIVLFTDARQLIRAGAVAHLLSHFRHSDVGAVSAGLINGHTKSVLRSVINFLKKHESLTGSTIGVYGALYAIRKSCYKNIPDETILDDLLIPLQVIRQKMKVRFEEKALVYDLEIEKFYSTGRTMRILQGLVQIIRKHAGLILSLPARIKLCLYCQKYSKLLIPSLLALVFLNIAILSYTKLALLLLLTGSFVLILMAGFKESFLLLRLGFNILIRIFRLRRTDIRWEKLQDRPAVDRE